MTVLQIDNKNGDWRLQGQEKYLFCKTLGFKKYADKTTTTDHDHCEFCAGKFSNIVPDCLIEGYATTDDYHWICKNCYNDFKDNFKWMLLN